jgi:hypothetical protein
MIGLQLSLSPAVPQRRTPFAYRVRAIFKQPEPVKVINNSTDIDNNQFLLKDHPAITFIRFQISPKRKTKIKIILQVNG